MLSMTTAFSWSNARFDDVIINAASANEESMRRFGYNVYPNEENENCENCDWKQLFWGNEKYNRLLQIKQRCDSQNVFWCAHCVASDLS